MLQLHVKKAVRHVAHPTGEDHHRAGLRAVLKAGSLRSEVEIRLGHEDAEPCLAHPPVIGGKKATSRTPASGVSSGASSWSTAARTADRSEKASA